MVSWSAGVPLRNSMPRGSDVLSAAAARGRRISSARPCRICLGTSLPARRLIRLGCSCEAACALVACVLAMQDGLSFRGSVCVWDWREQVRQLWLSGSSDSAWFGAER
jgi:hypothetical protein